MVERPEGSASGSPDDDRPEPIQISFEVAQALSVLDAERDAGKVSLLPRQRISDLFAKVRSDIRKNLEILG